MPGNQWLSNAYALAETNGILPQDPPEQLKEAMEEGLDEADSPMEVAEEDTEVAEEVTEEEYPTEFDGEAEQARRDYLNNARCSIGNVDVNLNLSKNTQSNTASSSNSLGRRLLGAVDSVGVSIPSLPSAGANGTDNGSSHDNGNVAINVNLSRKNTEQYRIRKLLGRAPVECCGQRWCHCPILVH
jgi:hypothetical protein